MTRKDYLQDATTVAEQLLGKLLIHRTPQGETAGMIVETEAYMGAEDKGAHSYGGRRGGRTEVMYGMGGYAYIFLIYGMHSCFNVVTSVEDKPQAVLVRALEPVRGLELMGERRNRTDRISLCNGPGKLCAAMGITRADYGADLCGDQLYIEAFRRVDPADILVSPRVNIDYAQEYRDCLWRYYLRNNPFVSKVPKKYQGIPLK